MIHGIYSVIWSMKFLGNDQMKECWTGRWIRHTWIHERGMKVGFYKGRSSVERYAERIEFEGST